MKVRPWHKVLVLAVVLLCLLALGAIIKRSHSPSTAEANDHATDAGATPYAAVAPVKRETIATTLSIAGQFIPYQNVELHAKVAGYIRTFMSILVIMCMRDRCWRCSRFPNWLPRSMRPRPQSTTLRKRFAGAQ